MPLIDADELSTFARETLRRAGYGSDDADTIASHLLEASLRGIDSHGVPALLPQYVAQVVDGEVDPAATPRVARDRGVCAVLDGRGAPGISTAAMAVGLAAAKATSGGAGIVTARNCGYLGAIGLLARPLAERDLIGLLATNSEACVAPHGGREALHGTNPLAVAVPADPHPIVFDMRTNALRMADYWAAVEQDQPLPEGTLLDSTGRPSRDPRDVDNGVFLPVAGAKGYGLALLVDVLTAGLAGGMIGRDVPGPREAGFSLFVLAIDPAWLAGSNAFADAVERLAFQVHATQPSEPGVPVRLPGERAEEVRRQRSREGVPVPLGRWIAMTDALIGLGVQVNRVGPIAEGRRGP